MASEEFKSRDVNDALGDLAVHVFRWLALVAAVALGVFLGIYLFVRLVGAEMQQNLHDVWTPSISTTPTWSTPAP
jgi:hypothetical protein